VKNDKDENVPVEVQTMSDLRGRNGSEFIVKLQNWRMAKERRLYRLYLEVWIKLATASQIGAES